MSLSTKTFQPLLTYLGIIGSSKFNQLLLLVTSLVLTSQLSVATTATELFPVSFPHNQYCTMTDDYADNSVNPKNAENLGYKDITCLKQALKPYQIETQSTQIRYQAYKANAWLSYLNHEKSEASLTTVKKFALSEALAILTALQSNQAEKLPQTTDIPIYSGIGRPDLWATLITIKQAPTFDKLTKQVADSEVKLVWAQAENCEQGWRHANEHFAAVNEWVAAARVAALNQPNISVNEFTAKENLTLKKLLALRNKTPSCQGANLAL